MAKKELIIEVCSRCGSEFDLSYDFEDFDESFVDYSCVGDLCWKCRSLKTFSKILGERQRNAEELGEISLALLG